MQSDELAASLVRLASVDQPIRQALRDILAAGGSGSGTPPDLPRGGGGGNDGNMEPRIAKLEAHMENVRSELSKLATVPADLAALKERSSHLPTKAEVKADLDSAVDRLGTRIQRQVGIVGAIVAVAVSAVTIGSKLLGS